MTNLSIAFYEKQAEYKKIKQAYYAMRKEAKDALFGLLPSCGEKGVTAAELSVMCGIDSRDIASILTYYRGAFRTGRRTYVLLNEDGTVNHNRKIAIPYRVRTYHR